MMKRISLIFIFVVFFILGCKKSIPSPQDVAKFITDINENRIENVEKAIKNNPSIKYCKIDVGIGLATPLDVAIYKANDDIVKLIADEHNATLAHEPYFETPLMFALEMGLSADCIQYLMKFYEKYDAVDVHNSNILHYFFNNHYINLDTWNVIKPKITVEMINQKNDLLFTPIHGLIWMILSDENPDSEMYLTIFNDLLDMGADLDVLFEKAAFEEYKNFTYMELLITYYGNSYIESVLNHLSDPLPNYDEYRSYAIVAYLHNNYEIIPKLIPYLKDINLCTKKNETILFWSAASTATNYTDKSLIKLILEYGGDKNIINNDGDTAYSAYMQLCKNPDEEIINLLK